MVFPNSYLPTTSQPWGREVQKRIELAETAITRNEKNNDARDTQLAASMDRLSTTVLAASAAATKAQQAVDGIISVEEAVYYPGTTQIDGGNIRANTIAANAISAGTLTGFTVQTASSGQRVDMSGTNIKFYSASGSSPAGSIYGDNLGGGGFVEITAADTSYISAGGGSVVLSGPGGAAFDVLASEAAVSGGPLKTLGGLINTGTITSTGSVSTNQGLIRTAYAGGGTTGASYDNNGNLIRTTSSERYKQDIEDLEFTYEDVIALEPKKFKLKDEAKDNPDARYYAGLIAEELAGTPLDIFVGYQTLQDGTRRPDSVYYAELTTALLSAIKHQDGLINSLEARIAALESKVE